MKKLKRPATSLKKLGRNGAARELNGRRNGRSPARGMLQPKTELEAAVQRYVDLYDFAPIAYVSFDRAGRVEEANLAATELMGQPRDLLIGRPFAFYVADLDLFLLHLLHCRTSQQRVETELPLKSRKGERIPVLLCSTPITSTTKNGALLYQTAIMDLRERKKAEAELRASELRYRTLFDLVPVAVYACDADGTIQTFNRRAAELWGREPNSNNGATERFCGSYKLYYSDGRVMPPDKCPMARVLREEKLVANELEMIVEKSNGDRRSVIATPTVLRDENGKIIGAINCLYDITDRKRAEAGALRLAAVVRSSHDAIVGKDLNGIITDWNESAERIFGYKPEEVIGKSILILIPQERQSEEQDILNRIRRGRSIDHYETVRQRKDGRLIDVSLTISPIKDARGKIIGVSKIARDITTQKQAERRLIEQARLLDLSNDAIIVRDMADRVLYWNKGAEKMYGYTREEVAGRVTHDLLKTEYPEPLPRILEALLRDDRWQGEIIHHRRDGTAITTFSRWSLDRDANGEPAAILETNTDITERKAAQEKAAWLALFPENNPSPILELDLKKRALYYANPAAIRLLANLQGRGFGNPFFVSLLEAATPLLKGGTEPVHTEIDFGGSSYAVSIVPVEGTKRLRVYSSNISDRKTAENRLAEAARQRETLYQFVQLRSLAQSLQDIYSAALDAILKGLRCERASLLLLDKQHRMRFAAWFGLSERYRKAVEGHSPWKSNEKHPQPVCVADIDLADVPKPLQSSTRAEGIRAAAFVPLMVGGKLIGKFMAYYNSPHVFSRDELSLAVTIAQQIAHGIQRKRSDEALRESEERMRAIVEQSTAGMARSDLNGRLVFANASFCEMLGYKMSELIGKPISRFTHPDDAKKTGEMFRTLIAKASPYDAEKRYIRKDGSTMWVRVSASPVHDAHGKTQSVVAVAVDITTRKKVEVALQRSKQLLEKLVRQRTKALRESNVELQSEIMRRKGLEGELLAISDREQQRIGQELHDGVCQELTAIGFFTRATALRLKNHRVIEVDDLEKIAQMINKSVMDARAIARDLHKEEIDAAGFARALRDLAERKIWKTRCRLKMRAPLDLEEDKVASELYRILREALINANKHAKATEILLEVCRRKDHLLFSVTDNGVGLAANSKLNEGLGFHIMKYRAQSIGARLEFEVPKAGGTRVACYLPVLK